MRDFLNFDIVSQRSGGKIHHTLKHNKRDGAIISFETPRMLDTADIGALFKRVVRAYAAKYREKTLKTLTQAQKSFYDKIVQFHKDEGRAPTYDEQCIIMGVSSKGTPHYYVQKLEKMGWVWIDDKGMVIPIDIAAPDME